MALVHDKIGILQWRTIGTDKLEGRTWFQSSKDIVSLERFLSSHTGVLGFGEEQDAHLRVGDGTSARWR